MIILKLISFEINKAVEDISLLEKVYGKVRGGQADAMELRAIGIPRAAALIEWDIRRGIEQELFENYCKLQGVHPALLAANFAVLTPQEVLEIYKAGQFVQIGSLVQLPGGRFNAGDDQKYKSEFDKKAQSPGEIPVHRVEITPFLISPYTVTNGEFSLFIEAGGYQNQDLWDPVAWNWKKRRTKRKIVQPAKWEDPNFNDPNQPVVGISFYEAEAYAKWRGMRLPTEHEWEYAARGGKQRQIFPWGNSHSFKNAHFERYNSGKKDAPLEVNFHPYKPNSFGLFHMAGNVDEWVSDWYDCNYYDKLKKQGIVKDPKGVAKGEGGVYFRIQGKKERRVDQKIVRGGAWFDSSGSCTVFHRTSYNPTDHHTKLGFRVAKNLV